MVYKYYKSDFQLIVLINLKRHTTDGSLVPVTTSCDFNLRFFVMGCDQVYVASHTGGSVHNCYIVDDSHVVVFFDHNQMEMPTGNLMLEAEFIIPDTNYEGDGTCNIKRLYSTGVHLTRKPDLDDDGTISTEIVVPGSFSPSSLATIEDVNSIFQ